MLANIIYVVVAIILIFVLYLAVKAITRGVEAKSELSKEKEESDIKVQYPPYPHAKMLLINCRQTLTF